jgi:hypothetical protein
VDSIPAAAFLVASELPSMVECRKLNDVRVYKTETHATATFGMLPVVIQQIPGVYELRRIELVALLALLCRHPLSFVFTDSPLLSHGICLTRPRPRYVFCGELSRSFGHRLAAPIDLPGIYPISRRGASLLVDVELLQVLTDRFALEGPGTACATDDRKYCGGSYRGIIDKLDYIQNLGFDAIWISPIVANVEGFTVYGEAYHGYWAQDIYKLNPHFGSSDDLIALSNALHARKMYLMVDVVVNHFGPANSSASYASFNPLNQPSDFHPECLITDYNNQTDVEQCWLGDDKLALADVNTENPWIVNAFNLWIKSLVNAYRIDGIRIDTVKHVRKSFWPAFAASSGVYTVGEVYDGDVAYVADYTRSCPISSPPSFTSN